MDEVLKVEHLSKSYRDRKIIKDVGFTVYKKDIFGLLGQNGAGKSTIMKLILSLINKDSGKIYINKFDVDKEFKKAMESISAIIEAPSLYTDLSGYDNLKVIKNLDYCSKETYSVDEILEIIGLKGSENKKVAKYSLGMKQRLSIGMALLKDSDIIILDEPTNGLDPMGIIEIRDLIKTLSNKYNKTIIISSHQLHEIELICNRIAIIKEGIIIKEGSIEELIDNTKLEIKIVCDKTEELIKKIKSMKEVEILDKNKNYIIITSIINPEVLLKKLINIGCEIKYFEKNYKTLEAYFVNITEDNYE